MADNAKPVGGAGGTSLGGQDIDSIGTGTDLTALPQRRVSPDIYEGQDYNQALSLKLVGRLIKLDTTPDVGNNEHWIAQNTVPVNVTDFDNGQDGHHIYILGDGFTTTVHSADIINVAGVNLLLDAGVIFHYVNVLGTWYQICCSDGGGGGGSVAWVDITGKPAVFPPDYVGFPPDWGDISGKPSTFPPDYVTYPPAWSTITGKPSTFEPDYINFPPVWGDIVGVPSTFPPDYVTYPPAWGDLIGVPAVFPPDLSAVNLGDLANVDTSGQTATMFLRYDGAQWIAESVGVGSSTLAGLTDVNIPGPSNNQVLTYNTGTSKWIAVTPTAGGDVFLAGSQTFLGQKSFTLAPLPATDNAVNLGSTSLRWQSAYLGSFIQVGTGVGNPVSVWGSGAIAFTTAGGVVSTLDNSPVSYGAFKVTGTSGGYAGIQFASAFDPKATLMFDSGNYASGIYYATLAEWAIRVTRTSSTSYNIFLGPGSLVAPFMADVTYGMVQGTHSTTPTKIYVGSNADPSIYIDADACNFRTQTGTVNFRVQRTGTTCNIYHQATTGNCGTTTNPWDTVQVILNGGYYVNAIKVVGNRVTGWNAPTGTLTRGTFAVAGATTASTAQALAALITDLRTHGLINT